MKWDGGCDGESQDGWMDGWAFDTHCTRYHTYMHARGPSIIAIIIYKTFLARNFVFFVWELFRQNRNKRKMKRRDACLHRPAKEGRRRS